MIIVREAPSIHHEQPEFHMHDGMAKYLKKTTTDLTIGISALISGSDIYHIYITYTTKHTKKLAWFEHWCQVSSVWCSRSPFVVIGLCKFCTISAVHQIRVGLLLVAFTIPKIRIPFLIFYNTICLSFIYR